MILRARTPKSLSWAGRLAVMGVAALLLPLAPSWAQKDDKAAPPAGLDPAKNAMANLDLALVQDREREEIQAKEAELLKALADQLTGLFPSGSDEARLANRITNLARLSRDDEEKGDDKGKGRRDTAERIEEILNDLIAKLGKELGPVGEEIRKALEQAVREVHESLEKEGVSVEDLRRALEKSHTRLRGAVEKGGPVNEEMRKAMERSRDDVRVARERAREALEGTRKEYREAMRDRLESARERQRELADRNQLERARRSQEQAEHERARAETAQRERLHEETEKRAAADRAGQATREQLETARKEIRELEQQLRRANRRLEELQRRESLRNAAPRRSSSPRTEPGQPEGLGVPRVEAPRPPRAAAEPAAPATPARPAQPSARRPVTPPRRPSADEGAAPPRGAGAGARPDYERRFRQLDQKLNRLLEELERMKKEKKPDQPTNQRSRAAHPAQSGALTFL
jgi:hypothetical protein